MNIFKKFKVEFILSMAMAQIHLKDNETSFAYFSKAYYMSQNTDSFYHSIALYGMGYCNCLQIVSEYTDYTDVNAKMPVISIPELSEAIEWMEIGINKICNSKPKLSKKWLKVYCIALGELGVMLAYAGRFNDAAQMLKRRIDLGRQVLTKNKLRKSTSDKVDYELDIFYATCLVKANRFDEAIQYCPCSVVLANILKVLEETGRNRMDALPYVLTIIENAKSSERHCTTDDLEYANRWLSEFYQRTGNYAASLAIEMEDLLKGELGKKKNRTAVSAYISYARNAINVGAYGNVEQILAKAYKIAVDEFDACVDDNAKLTYDIFLLNFTLFFEMDNDKADYFLGRALEFFNKRVDVQKMTKGENAKLADVDQIAWENITISKASLYAMHSDYKEAYKLCNSVLASHERRRLEYPKLYKNIFDGFYAEILVQNVLYELRVYNGRTAQTDENIKKLMKEIANITNELKQVTEDGMREDFVAKIQIWINILLSYWIEFPDHTIDTEELYVLELNTKNLSKEIQYLQNRALQKAAAVSEDVDIRPQYRNLQKQYQEALFEHDEFKQERQFSDKRIRLASKKYRFLKESDYEFVFYDLKSLQNKLGNGIAVLEFRKFKNIKLGNEGKENEQEEFLYSAFFITNENIAFVSLGNAKQVEETIIELLYDIEDQSLLDAEKVSNRKLKNVEELLLAPFAEELLKIKGIYIIPDDALYKVPFEIMPIWNRESIDFCGIKPEICYLASARSILREHKGSYEYYSIRIIANPKFQIENNQQQEFKKDEKDFAEWEMKDARSFLLKSHISELPYTEFEAEMIAKLFSCKGKSAKISCDRAANKNNVFTHQTDILHLATHGFMMPFQSISEAEETFASSPYKKRLKRIANTNNPFLRCGLLLAGVCNWLCGAEVDGLGNGLLTGMDILAEHLKGYKLVVLSACNTGNGQISCYGNGIEGLRSAFELAGVPVLLCTLWSVDDFATALFMEAFYGGLLVSGKPLQALYNAKQIIRTLTYADLEERGFTSQTETLYEKRMALAKEERPFEHPRYWAGFILHGALLEG